MKKTEKVILRHNELKKLIKENDFNDKKKLYKFYLSEIKKKSENNEDIKPVDYQTICNDLNYLQVKADPDTNVLCLPLQIQINNYRKILGYSLKSNNVKISSPIKILSNNTQVIIDNNKKTDEENNNADNINNIELNSLYKIIIFYDEPSTDIINSLIYKCFSNISILGSIIGFKCLELYFEDLEVANKFICEIKKIISPTKTKKKSKK